MVCSSRIRAPPWPFQGGSGFFSCLLTATSLCAINIPRVNELLILFCFIYPTVVHLQLSESNTKICFFPLQTLTHPVLYRLMSNKWFGEFRTLARSPLLSLQYLKWCLQNIWCVFDVLFFPVLLVLFYIIHICRDKARKKRGNLLQRIIFIRRLRICSVRTIISKFSTHPFEMIA